MIKGYSGATHLLYKDESALIRWETCGPDIACIVSEFEDLIDGDRGSTEQLWEKETVETWRHTNVPIEFHSRCS